MYQSLFALFRAERNADSELCSIRVTSDPDLAPFRITHSCPDLSDAILLYSGSSDEKKELKNLWKILAAIVEQTLKEKNTWRFKRRTVMKNLSSSEMVKVSIQSSNFCLIPSLLLASLLLAFLLSASHPSSHLAYLRFMLHGIRNPSRRKKKVHPQTQHKLIYESIFLSTYQ